MAKYIITALVEVTDANGYHDPGFIVACDRWGPDDPDSVVDYSINTVECQRVE